MGIDVDRADGFDAGRRRLLAAVGPGLAALAAGGGGGLGGIVTAILATPAAADRPVDIQIAQTASSLERLLVDTYAEALGKGPLAVTAPAALGIAAIPVPGARDFVAKFLETAHAHHDEHRLAFQALTTTLGGTVQDAPNPKFAGAAGSARLATPTQLLDYAAVLEKIVVDTYLLDLTLLEDVRAKEQMAAVMGVEAQHLAMLKTVSALFKVNALDAVQLPVDPAKLPAAFGSLAFPDALHKASEAAGVAQPESGALP